MSHPVPKNPWVAWAWDAGERALRAYAAAFASLVGADQAFTKFDLSFLDTLVAAFIGMVVSALFSLAGKKRGSSRTASLLK